MSAPFDWAGLLKQGAPYLLKGLSSLASFSAAYKARKAGYEAEAQYEAARDREQRALRLQAARRQGTARRAVAAAGWDPNRGSPAWAAAESVYLDELDAQMAYWNMTKKAQRARLDGETLSVGAAMEGVESLSEIATRALRGLGPKPKPLSGASVQNPVPNAAGMIYRQP